MPCQCCSSPSHTLSRCNANMTVYIGVIEQFMETSSFALRHQYQYLNQFSKPVLAVICNRLGFGCSFSKLKLIAMLIAYYFRPLLTIDLMIIQVAAEQLKAEVKEAYVSLQMWNIHDKADMCDFRNAMFSLLERYHRNAFGLSYSQQLINDLIEQNDPTTILPFEPVFQNIMPPPLPLPLPPPPPAAVSVDSSKTHLKKLKIKVKLDTKLKVQECFMCCDEEKPIARLGCSHEYCVDCVVKCAKVRTKSFIVCAICRVEVEEIHVGNNDLKKSFVEQIKKE